MTPVPREGYRIGAPVPGMWRTLFNSDLEAFGGSGMDIPAAALAGRPGMHGLESGLDLRLPPLSCLVLEPAE